MARPKTKNPGKRSNNESTAPRRRASWRGMLRFGLVTFPVEAFNARSVEGAPVALHQLHAPCHSRIRYQKTCPVHGPVSNDEIVSGFEYGKGRYVEIDRAELDDLRSNAERALTVDAFISPEEIDPIYFDGRMYLLSPDGDAAREPYAVILGALRHEGRWGIGQIVFSGNGKQELVVVRPYRDTLHMAMLNYTGEIRDPDEILPPLPAVTGSDKKIRLAEQLIESWTEHKFDLSQYHDTYSEKVKELILAKAEGRELVVPETAEEPEVINLMDALRQSIGKPQPRTSARSAKTSRRGARKGTPHRRHAS